MSSEYKNSGSTSEPLNDFEGIRRAPQNSYRGGDGGVGNGVRASSVQGTVQRPANSVARPSLPKAKPAAEADKYGAVRRPAPPSARPADSSGAAMRTVGNARASVSASGTVRRSVQSAGKANGGASSVHSVQSSAEARNGTPAVRRAVSGQRPANNVRSANQKRAVSASDASSTRNIDRESLRRERKSREAKESIREEDTGDGGSAVMSLIKAILYIVVVVAVAGLLSYYIIVFANDMYAFVKSSEEVEVTIPEYATVEEIAEILGDADVVKYPDLLVLYAKLKKIDKTYEFIAGNYTVNGMMNYDELFYAFVKHKSYEVVRITIPEGYTIDEMITLFTENGIGTKAGFVDAINNYDFDYDFVRALDEADHTGRTYRLEGYLYPDTYEFYKGSSEETVIAKMLNRFDVIFSDDFYEKAEALGYTVDEIMTLASMIEKEARYSQDYELVSSVFHNRLSSANYPRLESDATIMYAIQVRDGERKSFLTGEDLKYDTPYNSYMYEGLPPGPIANPGYEAITCALWPAKSKYYYFVSDNYGNTYFSKTLAEHNAAISKVEKINEAAG